MQKALRELDAANISSEEYNRRAAAIEERYALEVPEPQPAVEPEPIDDGKSWGETVMEKLGTQNFNSALAYYYRECQKLPEAERIGKVAGFMAVMDIKEDQIKSWVASHAPKREPYKPERKCNGYWKPNDAQREVMRWLKKGNNGIASNTLEDIVKYKVPLRIVELALGMAQQELDDALCNFGE